MTKHFITLSTTEPNNYVGLLKMRQGDINTQEIEATITANGQLFKFDNLSVFFNAVLPNGNIIRDKVTEVDYANSKLHYIVSDSFLQEVAQVTAWFSFENGEKIIDSTKNFQYSVIPGWKECIPQGNYIYELSEIQREIEEIISNKDFTTLLSELDFLKTNIAYLDNNIKTIKADLNNSINDKLSQISSVPETFANLAALQSTYPKGKTGLFVTADNGHKYIWANSKWTDAGVYQSTGLADGSVTPSKLAPSLIFPMIYCAGPINVNTITKMIEFPSGTIKLPNGDNMEDKSFKAQSVPYDKIKWLVYDLNSETIRMEVNQSGNRNAMTIGWVDNNGWLSINGTYVTRDGQLALQGGGGTISTFATPLIYSSPTNGNIIYDAKASTVRFPKLFNLTYGTETVELRTKSNGGTVDDVITIPYTQFLVYVPSTKNIVATHASWDNIVLGYVDLFRKQIKLNTQIVEIINDKDIKITYLGDSITSGVNTSKRYLEYIEDKLTAQSYDVTTVNLGIGGTTIASSSDRPNGFVTRWQNIPSDSDVIVVFGGTNDYGASIPMGEMTDDKTTFKGALNYLITSIQNAYPNADLLVLTPIKRCIGHWTGEGTMQDGDKLPNNKGLLLSNYVDALKEVSGNNGAKVIDLYDNSGFNPRVQANYNRNTVDGLHPNAVGHYLLYKQIYPEVLNCAKNREQVTDPKFHN